MLIVGIKIVFMAHLALHCSFVGLVFKKDFEHLCSIKEPDIMKQKEKMEN